MEQGHGRDELELWAAGVLGVAAAVAYLCKVMTDTFSVSKLLSDVNKEANKTVAEQKGKILMTSGGR